MQVLEGGYHPCDEKYPFSTFSCQLSSRGNAAAAEVAPEDLAWEGVSLRIDVKTVLVHTRRIRSVKRPSIGKNALIHVVTTYI